MAGQGLITKFTNCCLLRDHQIIKDDLWVQDGKIIDPMEVFYKHKKVYDLKVDCEGALISPGYIDLQLNGGFGCDFSHDIEKTEECVRKVAKGILPHGVTSFCPTLVTSGPDVYKKVIPRIMKQQGGEEGASVLGVHCEGPFISPEKKGAHCLSSIKDIDQDSSQALQVTDTYGCLENIVIVTLAPEMPNALNMIEFLAKENIVVSLGHSNANIDISIKGVEKGATFITHLFNAMSAFHHRDPGIVGLLASHYKNVFFGLIADGIHTHPAALRIAHRTHSDGTVVVTDALSALGLPDGIHYLGSKSIEVKNGCAYLAGTDTICGSITNFAQCIRIFKHSTGCSTVEALEVGTLHPAQVLKIENQKGTLKFGADADLIFLNENLEVLQTWISGKCVFKT
ncbi:N-acetylglucosamine-6-phosphate deacetylase isoform X1 [Nilaparvata lugens]|uniref:N-acetylglucosamine-6-phosphate deacetylase isoform X1 n=1 Tax=Nilaparvata lugens TaxID=108931 RepID=UPI00193D201D|nr:N-acetylglucosamine-6-phosphate deacetylase isoform X1 [Nilaparvata lugens]